MTSGQRRLIFILAGISGVMTLGVMGFVGWMTIRSITSPPKATGDDRKLVLTADALVPFGAPKPDPQHESMKVMKQFDGTRAISYVYSPPLDTTPRITISTNTTVTTSSLTAMQTYKLQQMATKGTMALMAKRAPFVERPDLLTIGDSHWAAVIQTADGQPSGNMFMMRQGRVIFTVVVGGIAFTKPADANRLMTPLVEETKKRY